MELRIGAEQLGEIERHSARDYPNECCGAMLGVVRADAKHLESVAPLSNIRTEPARAKELLPLAAPGRESERNRFLIDPVELLRVEKEARQRGLEIIGFYHSHPDHPARPSEYDRDHAFPWYSYVIIAVDAGKPGLYTSWVLREDRSEFERESIEIVRRVPPGGAGLAT